MHSFYGSYIPLPQTAVDAAASGDPRRPVRARYETAQAYAAAVRAAGEALVARRLMLEEDLGLIVRDAEEWGRPRYPGRS